MVCSLRRGKAKCPSQLALMRQIGEPGRAEARWIPSLLFLVLAVFISEDQDAALRTSAFGRIFLLWRSKLSLNRSWVPGEPSKT